MSGFLLPELGHNAIHVWRFDIFCDPDQIRDLPEQFNWLSDDDRHRASQIKHAHRYATFTQSRIQLRWLLGQYLNVDPQDLSFVSNAHGKPRLADTPENQGLVFSLSHSGNLAIIGFCRDTYFGLDVERIKPDRDVESLARHCLAGPELDQWQKLGNEIRPDAFTRYWTAKEAFAKAVGRGLGIGLKTVMIKGSFTGYQSVPAQYGSTMDWHLDMKVMEDYRIAIAYKAPSREILFGPSPLGLLPACRG